MNLSELRKIMLYQTAKEKLDEASDREVRVAYMELLRMHLGFMEMYKRLLSEKSIMEVMS